MLLSGGPPAGNRKTCAGHNHEADEVTKKKALKPRWVSGPALIPCMSSGGPRYSLGTHDGGVKKPYQNRNADRAAEGQARVSTGRLGMRSCKDYGRSRVGKKGNPGEIDTGVPYQKSRGCTDGSPSAALGQPHLVTTTHWTTSFR
jgi:hypothetical protein